MTYKKSILLTAILMNTFHIANAEYNVIVTQDYNKYNITTDITIDSTSWLNIGFEYDCFTVLDPSDYNLGEEFTQTENCSQDQERTVTSTNKINNEDIITVKTETKTIQVSSNYTEYGLKNFNTGTENKTYSSWEDDGVHYDCEVWTPSTDTISLGTSFTQNRLCSQNQSRIETVYNIWSDGSETIATTNIQNQILSESESQNATGTGIYDTGATSSEYTNWEDDGVHYDCEVWIPSTDTINMGTSFTQNRLCSQNQSRIETVYNIWSDGSETIATTNIQNQILNENESQNATGTKNYDTGTNSSEYTSWEDDGGIFDCTSWTPDKDDVTYGESFTQERTCSQNQVRSRLYYNVWSDGSKELYSSENYYRVQEENYSRIRTGTEPYDATVACKSGSEYSRVTDDYCYDVAIFESYGGVWPLKSSFENETCPSGLIEVPIEGYEHRCGAYSLVNNVSCPLGGTEIDKVCY